MKKIILFFATVILMASCSDSKLFFGRQIDWVYQNEGNYIVLVLVVIIIPLHLNLVL